MRTINQISEDLVNQLARIEIEYGFILPSDFDDAMLANIQALDGRATEAEKTLNRIPALGHNDDCILCGFKDRTVKEWSDALEAK